MLLDFASESGGKFDAAPDTLLFVRSTCECMRA